MKIPSKTIVLGCLSLIVGAAISHAADINMNANDGLSTSSFNAGTHWTGGAAPIAGNNYNTAGYDIRTPGDGVTAYTFAGDSLTFGDTTFSGASGSLLEKFTGGSGSARTLTINNATNLAGAVIRSGGTAGALIHITGNHFTIAGSSTFLADQCVWVIDAPLLGGDNIILTNSAINSPDRVSYTGTNTGFTGSWFLTAPGNNAWNIQLDSVASLPGNPSTLNLGQITFLQAGAQLRDTVGCAFTNSNGGITLVANGTINTAATTLIGEPITDLTNGVHSVSLLTSSGTGTLILSNANNNYSGGTTISAGILQLGVNNAIPGNTVAGDVTINASTLDLNGHNAAINGLNGTGTVDTQSGGAATLTVGANGNSGTFSGTIQNSSGTLSLVKVGAGTETLSGGYTYSGATTVAGGTLSLNSASSVPSSPGDLVISNGAILTVNASTGNPLPANNLVVGTNSTLSLTPSSTANGINVAGSLTFQDNATNNFIYGSLAANPTAPAINVTGGISAPGSSIVINISAIGLKTGTVTLIKYGTGTLGSIANFILSPPPGVAATLVNNTGNKSIDLNITAVPNQLAWNGVAGTAWNLTTPNWMNTVGGTITVFKQYTNGSVVAGDAVVLDDTLTNDFINPQPTNITLNSTFFVFPFVMNSTLPYSISGTGGITGPTSLAISNTGSLTLLTSNSFTGGVSINNNGGLVIVNDSALGASSGGVALNGATLQMNGGVTNSRLISMPVTSTIGVGSGATARLAGVISGAGALNKNDNGTLVLAARETFTGNVFGKGGTLVIDSGGSINNGGNYSSIGQSGTDNATLILKGTGTFTNAADFNVGDIDTAIGTLIIQDTAVLNVNGFWIASANAAGSTASGTVNMTGGTLIERNTAVGNFDVGGRNSGNPGNGVGVLNLTNGNISVACGVRLADYGTGTINQYGGLLEVTNAGTGINIRRQSNGGSGTYNLNGGTLRTEKVTSSQTSGTRLFYFNGGSLQAGNPNLGATPFMNSLSHAYIRNGGAVVDSQGFSIIISQPLEHSDVGGDNAIDGGLTKLGTGTLTLTGTNVFTGSITNKAGTLIMNSPSIYTGALRINAGTVQITTDTIIQGDTTVSNGALFAVVQLGNATSSVSNLTFNGAASGPGATLSLTPATANNPNVALVNCGTLTLNGTNTINLAAANVGTLALVKYVGIAGSGNITNISLPQGATGYITNITANSTLYAVITSTGPGLTWTGNNAAAPNIWNIGITTNWLVGAVPTSYHQIIVPGDAVTFNDAGSGTVFLNTNVSPASVVISNTSKSYTFSGIGNISGSTSLQKLGTNTAVLSLTNNNYSGTTIISNGTLQVGSTTSLSPATRVAIGSGGTLQLAGFNQNIGELTGSGIADNNSGLDLLLTVGTGVGGTWNGSIQDHGGGGVGLIKNGGGTWVVGGPNHLNNASPFTTTNLFNAGTTIVTNGGSISVARIQTMIAFGGTANMIVAGGTLAVSNEVLAVGYSPSGTGTLTVNSGTVVHGGGTSGSFGAPNTMVVGGQGATGSLTINGGQVLNSQALWLGQNATGSGTLHLNGGLLQTLVVQANGGPATSIAYFNGGTLQAVTNTGDFIQSGVTPLIQSGGLKLDDGGFAVSQVSQGLQEDPSSVGGPLIKLGAGAVYLDAGNSYSGITLVTNGMLAGIGSVSGPVLVAPSGNLGAGDAAGIGAFTINNDLTLQGNATMRIDKTGGTPLQPDEIFVNGNATYGGILTVTNITSDASVLTTSDTFQLFSVTGTKSGNFAGIAGSPGPGLAYKFTPASGVLSIVTFTTASNPTNITFSTSGSTLALSWPADHLGWILQSQTNSLNRGIASNWADVAGSASVTSTNITIVPANPTVFYRLRSP